MPDSFDQIVNKVGGADPSEFNSEIHATTDTGQPKYTRGGKLRKKRGASEEATSEIEIEPELSNTSSGLYDEMGNVMAVTVTSSCTMLFGGDWKPEQAEVDAMTQAWSKYFEATGVTQFPPWLMLSMVHVGYAGKRLTMPETKSKLGRWIQRWRQRRNARTYRGYDEQRENHAGEESSAEVPK